MMDEKPDETGRRLPDSENMSEDDFRIALAISTSDLLRTSQNAFKNYLSSELDHIEIVGARQKLLNALIDKKMFTSSLSVKRILLSPLAHDIMNIIWRESPYLTDGALELSGHKRRFYKTDELLTKSSLAYMICDDMGIKGGRRLASIKRTLDRICDGLEIYNLAERTELRSNLKPIQGTEALHSVMVRTSHAVSHIFAKQLQKGGCE